MQSKSAEMPSFNPISVPGLSDEARKAVKAAFDAMLAWRTEIANFSEKYDEQVTEQMAAAAKALGWPQQVVDATRAQMQSVTGMQIEMMDNMMGVWEEQIKAPNRMTGSPSAMLAKLQRLPGLGGAGDGQNANPFQMGAFNPFQPWLQMMEHWQKSWMDVMAPGGKGRRAA